MTKIWHIATKGLAGILRHDTCDSCDTEGDGIFLCKACAENLAMSKARDNDLDEEKGRVVANNRMEPEVRNRVMNRLEECLCTSGSYTFPKGGPTEKAIRECDKRARALDALKQHLANADQLPGSNNDYSHGAVHGYKKAIAEIQQKITSLLNEPTDELDWLDQWIDHLSAAWPRSVPLDILRGKVLNLRRKRSETS
jgi:hypothetical protein